MPSPFDPNRSARQNLAALRRTKNKVFFVSTGPRDTGQSDYKNRHTFYDLIRLAPLYEEAGYFAVEMHGGARFHQDLMHNKTDPFGETRAWKAALRHTFTQTLIRSTNAFGYRAYPRNVLKRTVEAFLPTIDVWRCFDFLNHVPNMVPVGEAVLEGGRIFEPAISYTESRDTTDDYYLKVTRDIVEAVGGPQNFIRANKDMAGVGSPARIYRLVDKMLQKWPELIIDYHRHSTDGLGVPAVVEAARAGAKLIDVTDDGFSRFYGQPPIQAVVALLREQGIKPAIEIKQVRKATDQVRGFIRHYDKYESPYRGFAYDVTQHRMPGGAFPSSFEQAEKGGFLDLMPAILKGMALGNKIIQYFDVTPGSQISWTTWAAIMQRTHKDGGDDAVSRLLNVLGRFVDRGQRWARTPAEDQELLLTVYGGATDDLKNLLLGAYGPLPFGWPAEWVYRSAFGENWMDIVARQRSEGSKALLLEDEDIDTSLGRLETELGRMPSEEELILYLAHPQATVDFVKFREKYGYTTCLPTPVWFNGLGKHCKAIDLELLGKPHRLELISVGATGEDGTRQVVLSVNNQMQVFSVEMPEAAASGRQVTRMVEASNPGHVGAPVKGNLWRIGNRKNELAVGDRVNEGDEVANLEVMKTENAVYAGCSGTVTEIVADKNAQVDVDQLLIVIEPADLDSVDDSGA